MTGLEWIPMWLLIVAIVWSLIWKGIALWQSARHGQKVWFIVLLIINTLGILEILYLLLWQKKPQSIKAKRGKNKFGI